MARKRGATKPKPTTSGRAGAKSGRGAADATESVAREVLTLLRTVDESVAGDPEETVVEEVPISLPALRSAADYLADAGVIVAGEDDGDADSDDVAGVEVTPLETTSYEEPAYDEGGYEETAYEESPFGETAYSEESPAVAEEFVAGEAEGSVAGYEEAQSYLEEADLDDYPASGLAESAADTGFESVEAADQASVLEAEDPIALEPVATGVDAVPVLPIEETFDLRSALDGLGDQIAPAATDPDLSPLSSARATRRARRSPRQIATLEAFTDEKLLLDAREYRGWRGMLKRNVNERRRMRLSSRERYDQELIARAKTPTRGGPRHVVVVSRKGGVGKTTTTLMLGDTLADLRGDRILAVDGNPDAGSLAYRVQRETSATVTDVLEDCDLLTCYAELRAYTSQSTTSHLEVLASDDDPRITQAMHHSDYQTLLRLVDRHYSVILVDTGTGILTPATQGLLAQADQLVIVTPAAIDGARVAAATLDWLEEHEYARLAAEAVVAINAVRNDSLVDVPEIEAHFGERARATVRIPWDPHLATGGQTDRKNLTPPTRTAYLELAAAVAEGFATPIKRRQEAKA